MKAKQIVYEKIKKYTNKKFNESSNVKEIGLDSLDLVEVITDAEEEFGIEITDDQIMAIKTVGDVINLLEKLKKIS